MSNCNCHTAFPFSTCNPSIASSLVYYSGPNLPCSGIINKDTLTVVIQKIDSQLCGENLVNNVFNEILNNAELYQQFVDLVNGAIDCSTILACLTTTTTTTAIPCSRWGYNYASYSCNICEFIDYGFLYNSNPLTLNNFYQYEGLTITPYEFVGCDSGDSDASIPDTGVITCEEIVCTTTTTTTIAPRVCAIYGLQATILEGSWSALDCLGEPVNGLLTSGDTTYTPCIDVSTLEMVDGEIKITINC